MRDLWVRLLGVFSVFVCLTDGFTGRRCEFLKESFDPQQMKAGRVDGNAQHCFHTNCCMGVYNIVNGQPHPVKLGCNIFRVQCWDSCLASNLSLLNHAVCVCKSDFCNSNLTWKPGATHTHSYSSSQGTSDVFVSVVTLSVLLIIITLVAVLWWRNGKSSGKGMLLEEQVLTPHSHYRTESSDFDLSTVMLQEVLSHGQFSLVWQGNMKDTLVAVKTFPVVHRHKFIKERDIFQLPLMQHPGIVRFVGLGEIRREWVLVLELAEQGSLNSFLSANTCDWTSALRLAQTLSEGLAFLHSILNRNGEHKPAIAHCDLSSSNVLVRADGTCALCDFEYSVDLSDWRAQQDTKSPRPLVGTSRYISPEALEGMVNLRNDQCMLQGDVYALGLLLWELWMRCGTLYAGTPVPQHTLPYEVELGPNPSWKDLVIYVSEKRARPRLSERWKKFVQVFAALEEILEGCWDHDPDGRLTAQTVADRTAALSHQDLGYIDRSLNSCLLDT